VEDGVEDMETSVGYDDDEDDIEAKKGEVAYTHGTGRVAMQVGLLEHPSQKETTISPVKEQEKKRPRRNGGEEDDVDAKMSTKSVLSFEESDRTQ
jgi:hypothetical protein